MTYSYWDELEAKQFIHNYAHLSPTADISYWVGADMILGDARKRCDGPGICKISVRQSAHQEVCGCNIVPGWLGIVNNYYLQLVFDKRLLSLQQFQFFFPEQAFSIQAPLFLPPSICLELGLSQPHLIPIQKGPVFQMKHFYHQYVTYQKVTP